MRVILAKTAGFCFGVDRAVNLAYQLAQRGEKCCCLGPIIHNTAVTDDLAQKGVRIVETPEEIKPGESVIVRAHGVSPEVYEATQKMGANVCDATCPFVKKIHQIVQENSAEDIPTLIAGDPNHPEVMGIRGYCKGESFVFSSCEELEEIIKSNPLLCENRIITVAQTTFFENVWKKSTEIFNLYCTNAKIFDTICSATRKRQEEAEALSKVCDAMIVIGGRHSSNTVKLKNICGENCDTFLVETANELKNINFSTYTEVGVTAGASTPAVIIKEVLSAMSEIIKETENIQLEEVPSVAADSFEAMLDETFNDDILVKCTVMGITNTEIQVDIPKNHVLGGLTGILTYDEYSKDPDADPKNELKIGDTLNLVIMKKNDAEGTVLLSKKRADAQKSWIEILDAKETGDILEGVVTEIVKGGVIVDFKGCRVFIPASQATERRGDPLEELLKKHIKFRIIDIDQRRRRTVGSIRAILREIRMEAEEAFWRNIEVGKKFTGTVKSLTNYGAFVDLGGVDGMVHISEMSWKRIKHPSEIFEVGQEVEVYIKSLDNEKKRISLGYRKEEDNPWIILKKTYSEGDVVEGTIVGLTSFGAFANILPHIDGFIHISQIANRHIDSPASVLSMGEKVTCKITAIDYDKKRVSLSIRVLLPPVEETEKEETAEKDETEGYEKYIIGTDEDKYVTEEEIKEEPVAEEAAEEPAVEEAEEEPATEEVAEEPATEEAEEEPATEEVAEEPAEEPKVEEVAEESVAEEVVEEPAVEEAAEEPATEEVAEEPTEEPKVEEAAEESVAEEVVEEPAVEEAAEEPVAEEVAEEPADAE